MSPAAARLPPTRSRRGAVLREMGLGPLWRLRARDEAELPAAAAAGSAAIDLSAAGNEAVPPPARIDAASPRRSPAGPPAHQVEAAPPRVEAHSPTGARRDQPGGAIGRPAADIRTTMPARIPAGVAPERASRIATLTWDELEADIRDCTACVLCERRRQAVPGVGDRRARWMLVGEGPGAEEDQRGEPFVGQAGKLLDNMLAAIGLKRGEDVYIANAVKCRPPHNRTPEADEVAACLPYLERQIDLVQPDLLVALGRPAAQALLDMEVRIGAARGKLFQHRGIPVVVTYHPAYLLRNPQDKARAWEDLCFARRCMRERAQGSGA